MNIIAVVVTYNRLSLLKKCISAINAQTRKPDKVIVINNGSTDGTGEWLLQQHLVTYTQENKGGAAGFSTGIRKAYENGADWIWLMDDDTVPKQDALQQLMGALYSLEPYLEHVGFLASSVLWTDGTLHNMNRTWPLKDKKLKERFSFVHNTPYKLIKWGTFVSMLLSAKAVEQSGLPIKEFFIWSDDVEYSTRIIKNGMAGIMVGDSEVVHETPVNHLSNVFKDEPSSIWKYRYGLRNELYAIKKHKGRKAFWKAFSQRMFIWPLHIMAKRKSHRWSFIKVLWTASLSALRFAPAIETVAVRKLNNREVEKV